MSRFSIQFGLSIKICDNAYIIPSTPKVPIPVLVFQIGKLIKDHQTALPFEDSRKFAYAHFWRDRHQHVYDFYMHLLQ